MIVHVDGIFWEQRDMGKDELACQDLQQNMEPGTSMRKKKKYYKVHWREKNHWYKDRVFFLMVIIILN